MTVITTLLIIVIIIMTYIALLGDSGYLMNVGRDCSSLVACEHYCKALHLPSVCNYSYNSHRRNANEAIITMGKDKYTTRYKGYILTV